MINYFSSLLFILIVVSISILQSRVLVANADAVRLTMPELKSMNSVIQDKVSVGNQVFISTMLANMDAEKPQRFLVFVEVRDSNGVSRQINWVSSVIKGDGFIEISASWVPDRAGAFELRTFALNDFENLEVLSSMVIKQVVITDN